MCALIRDCWVFKSIVGSLSVCIGRAHELMASEFIIYIYLFYSFLSHNLGRSLGHQFKSVFVVYIVLMED